VIDLHCHLLPGVDDGAKTVEQAVTVLRQMAADGVKEVVLTPHLDASRVSEGPPPAHDEAFANLSRVAPKEIHLHRGAEVMLDRPLTPRAVATRRITLGGSRYLLVEFTRMVAAQSATTALTQVIKSGLVPLVAHPERYAVCSVPTVKRWREIGAVMQVDATTAFMPTGRGAKARELLAAGLADVLAADNHGDTRSLAEPFRRLAASGAEAQATALMVTNPAAILGDDELVQVAPLTVAIPPWSRLQGWLEKFRE
jgi:protein-tyrosine phosphatase